VILINFSHPMTADQISQVEAMTRQQVERLIDVPANFDNTRGFAEQARELLDGIGFSHEQWQTAPIIVNLPSFSPIAAVVLAELHGRMGYFPPVLRLRPMEGTVPLRYEVAEIISLQHVRNGARQRGTCSPHSS